MKILISGSHGFIGNACYDFLKGQGHEMVRLVRKTDKPQDGPSVFWDPTTGDVNKDDFEGFDAVIHLAGSNIMQKRWNKRVKEQIFISRCRDTWLLSEVLRRLHRPPKTLIAASAIGFYGNRGEDTLTEKSPQGKGFLADLCGKWEASTRAIENRGTRVVHTRFGAVLSPTGGMLGKLMPVYRAGLAPVLGNGKQYVSWIGLDDLLKITSHILTCEDIQGPVNVTAPFALPQKELSRFIALHTRCRKLLRIPAFLLRLFAGEIADEVLLSSCRAYPEKLLENGYAFKCPTLELYLLSEPL